MFSFGKVVKAPVYVLDVIQYEYIMPFQSEPTASFPPSRSSALTINAFVNQVLDELQVESQMKEVKFEAHVNSPNLGRNGWCWISAM